MTEPLFEYDASNKWWESRLGRQNYLLRMLKSGPKSTNDILAEPKMGHRFACEFDSLRARGYVIEFQRDAKAGGGWYTLLSVPAVENTRVTARMKEHYYATKWWREISERRKLRDQKLCTLCKRIHTSENPLQVHHWRYDLFAEDMDHLQTVCRECHEFLHRVAKVGWPQYVSPEIAARLGVEA